MVEKVSEIKITIGLVTYNRPAFLREAIQSVLQQSFQDFELIIANDYPSDPLSLESLGIKNDSRIIIVNNSINLGELGNMNSLLKIANGKWFVWLADDDLLHPEFLMLASKYIKDDEKKLVGFFSNYKDASLPDNIFPLPLKNSECVQYEMIEFLAEYTSRKISLVGCYGIMRLDVLKKIGGIPKLGNSFSPYGDTLIPILLSEYGNIGWIDENLIFLRTHQDSLSCKSEEISAYTSAEVDYLDSLNIVCGKVLPNSNKKLYIANMVRWFSQDELSVLIRSESRSIYSVMKQFMNHQFSINIPRLSFRYKALHLVFVVRLVIFHALLGVYNQIRINFKNNIKKFEN